MGPIHIDVKRVFQGGYLNELYLIPGQAPEFHKFYREGIFRKLLDDPFFSLFQVCNGKAQTLFRLILSRNKNKGIWGFQGVAALKFGPGSIPDNFF